MPRTLEDSVKSALVGPYHDFLPVGVGIGAVWFLEGARGYGWPVKALIYTLDFTRPADLSRADLFRANLQGVDLREANLSGAGLGFTIFGDANLSGAIGLESCHHTGPSVVDHQTMMKSWPLPVQFLRGCGLPETLIEYLPSIINRPIEFYSCFISYSTRDGEFGERLYADLQVKGIRCWFAPEDLKIGDRFRQRIDDAIRLHD